MREPQLPFTACRECGGPILARRQDAVFCAKRCQMAWHNRRRTRGAEMYDLVMAMRFDRQEAARVGAYSMLTQLASAARESDLVKRPGRPSWNLGEAVLRIGLTLREGPGDGR